MLLRFHTNFEQAFVAYPSTHLHTYMLLRYHLISFYQLYFILHTYVLLRYQLINTRVEMEMMPNLSAKYELTFCVSFYLLNNFEVITSCYKN